MNEDSVPVPGIDMPKLCDYLAPLLGCEPPEITVEIINGGRSNLTFAVCADSRQYVLRRPPLGHVLATAHDVGREYRVMNALQSTGVPVPPMILFEPDASVIGAPFTVGEFVPGLVLRTADDAAELTTAQAHAAGLDLVDRLVQLHGIEPESVGLESLGRPAGFIRRQIERWLAQWEQSAPDESVPMRNLAAALLARVPPDPPPGIVHGDYRLDNTILDASDPGRIAAIVDWEMASVGDPFADIAMLATYWGPQSAQVTGTTHPISGNAGFPTIDELVARYLDGRRIAGVDLPFYLAFGNFKLAGIASTIHARYLLGKTVGARFETAGQAIPELVRAGLDVLADHH